MNSKKKIVFHVCVSCGKNIKLNAWRKPEQYFKNYGNYCQDCISKVKINVEEKTKGKPGRYKLEDDRYVTALKRQGVYEKWHKQYGMAYFNYDKQYTKGLYDEK